MMMLMCGPDQAEKENSISQHQVQVNPVRDRNNNISSTRTMIIKAFRFIFPPPPSLSPTIRNPCRLIQIQAGYDAWMLAKVPVIQYLVKHWLGE